MASKKIILGTLILVILSASFYILLPEKVRIDFEKTRTIFKVYNETYETSGIEYSNLFDGTKKMLANDRQIEVINFSDHTEVYRFSRFKENISVLDTYLFDNFVTDVSEVPVSHEVCIENAKGKIFEYLIDNIEYDGITKSISSPFSFGKNMKVSFQEGYSLAKVTNNKLSSDKIQVRYKITQDLECFNLRLFDPLISYGGVTVYLDGVNSTESRKYEYFTTANISVRLANGSAELICVDIDDNIHNLTIGERNYTCGTTNFSFLYPITTLRINQFNDGDTSKALNNLNSTNISINPLVDLTNLYFNLTSPNLENIRIHLINDSSVITEDYQTTSICYQETATTSTECGGLNTGRYANGTIISSYTLIYYPYSYDGDWDTYMFSTLYGIAYINYSYVTSNNLSNKLMVKYGNSTDSEIRNLSIANCSQSPVQIKIELAKLPSVYVNYSCWNQTHWYSLSRNPTYRKAFEEAMLWNISETIYGSVSNSKIMAIIPGNLTGRLENTYKFLINGLYYTSSNLSFTSPSSKIIYLNVSSQGNFTNRVGKLNFTLTGFDLDSGNDFNSIHNFNNLSLMPYGNISDGTREFETYEDFLTNESYVFDKYDSLGWDGDVAVTGIGDFGGVNTWEQCDSITSYSTDYSNCLYAYRAMQGITSYSSAGYVFFNDLNFKEIGAFTMELGMYSHKGYGSCSVTNSLEFTDFANDINLLSCRISGNQDSSAQEADCSYNITGQRIDENNWLISYNYLDSSISTTVGSSYSSVKSISSLQNATLTIKSTTTGCPGAEHKWYSRVNYLNISGISLNRTNGFYLNPGSYISNILNVTPSNVSKMVLDLSMLQEGNILLYLSNDNGSTWEYATNGETHSFVSKGNIPRFKVELNTPVNYSSPIIFNYRAQVILTTVSGVTIRIGDNLSSMVIGVLNSSTSPKFFNGSEGNINEYLNLTCKKENLTCLIPITLISSSAGIVQISDMNLTEDINPISIPLSLIPEIEEENPIRVLFNFKGIGKINISDLKLDFFGSKNISILAHTPDYLRNDTKTLEVKYSKFNISLPSEVYFWEVFPKTKNDKNVTPYGQTNSVPIWNITYLAYEDTLDLFVKTNSSFDSCLNITFSNSSTNRNFKLNTSSQLICTNIGGVFVGDAELCYQETANISSSCGGLSTGTYGYNGSWNSYLPTMWDENWSTGSLPLADTGWSAFFINYSKPSNYLNSSLWNVNANSTVLHGVNISIPSDCWNLTILQLSINSYYQGAAYDALAYCKNNTGWKFLQDLSSGPTIYEEAMWWNITFSPIQTCNIWNYVDLTNCSGRFKIPYFFFSGICSDCVRTFDYDQTNLIID